MKNMLLIGASKGLGLAVATAFSKQYNTIWAVSRTAPQVVNNNCGRLDNIQWIQADLKDPLESSRAIKNIVGSNKIDTLIYNAGIWESSNFENTTTQALSDIVNVNLNSLLYVLHSFISNIKAAKGNVVLIGSGSGLPNSKSTMVAYAATKAAMQSISESTREILKGDGVRVTCIHPGSIATDIPFGGIDEALEKYQLERVPVEDIISIIDMILSLSPSANIKTIDVPSIKDP